MECLEIPLKNSPVLRWSPIISSVSSYPTPHTTPKKYSFFWKNPKVLKFKFEGLKMPRVYVYIEESEYPHPSPWAYALFFCPLKRFCWRFFGWHNEVWLNWRYIFSLSPDWSKCVLWSFNERFIRCIYGTHSFCPLYIRYSSSKYVSWPFFVRYLAVKYALLMRFMRS